MNIDEEGERLRQIASVENPVYESYLGRYFIGQSKLLTFGFNGYALGMLYNPENSGVNLYFSVVTATNTSDLAIKTRVYVNANIPEGWTMVSEVTPTNLTGTPPPIPKVKFLTWQYFTEEVTGGVKLLTRMTPPETTIVIEKNGKIILPPGGNLLTVLVPPPSKLIEADIAYGWWEQPIC